MFENKSCERVSVSFEKSAHVLDRGIGVNWHQHWSPLEAPCNAIPRCLEAPRDATPAVAEEDHWQIILDELSFVRPACIRFSYGNVHYLDEQGRFDWEAEGFIALQRLDEWARAHGATMIFDGWDIPKCYAFGEGADGIFYDAPKDIAAFVDGFVVPLIEHLVHKLKLETLTHYNLMGEPLMGASGTFLTPPGVDRFQHYVECYQAIHKALGARQLPIGLIGPDTWSMMYWAVDQFNERGLDLSPYIDTYDQHNYYSRFDYLPPNPTATASMAISDLIEHFVHKNARFAHFKGKKYHITELGTFYYGWRRGDIYGPATHEAFITEAEFIIRAMQVGCGGFYRWTFLAPGEYADGVWQFINTVDGSYTRQPHTYYGYASLMRYTAPGSVVWPGVFTQRRDPYSYVHATALELPDGSRTILVVNDNNAQERVIDIQLPAGWAQGRWQKLLSDRTRKMIRNEVQLSGEMITDLLPPMSLSVYTTRRVAGDEQRPLNRGVAAEE